MSLETYHCFSDRPTFRFLNISYSLLQYSYLIIISFSIIPYILKHNYSFCPILQSGWTQHKIPMSRIQKRIDTIADQLSELEAVTSSLSSDVDRLQFQNEAEDQEYRRFQDNEEDNEVI